MESIQIRDGEITTLELRGTIDINSARGLKESLLHALEAGKDISVCPEAVTALDISAAQLLWAAKRDAEGKGLQFQFAGAVREEVIAALKMAAIDLFSRSKEVL